MGSMTDPALPNFQQPPGVSAQSRVSHADRSETMAILDAAFRDGRLSPGEYNQRSAQTRQATYRADLEPLTADLVVVQDAHRADEYSPVPAVDSIPAPVTYPNQIRALMSSQTRRGVWRVPGQLDVTCLLSAIKLDMREAIFETTNVIINLNLVMGELKLWVPQGVEVIDQSQPVLSETKMLGMSPASPERPRILLRGRQIMATTVVRGAKRQSIGDRILGNL